MLIFLTSRFPFTEKYVLANWLCKPKLSLFDSLTDIEKNAHSQALATISFNAKFFPHTNPFLHFNASTHIVILYIVRFCSS